MKGAWLIGAAAALALAVLSQRGLERVPPPQVDANLLLVPPEALVTGLASGYENLAADGFWLGLLQYYGDRVAIDHHAVNLAPMFKLITRLDPHFEAVYWLGGWALLDNGEPDAAIDLLTSAIASNPEAWQYPYWRGMLRFLGQGDYLEAAKDFKAVQAYPGAPRFAAGLEARMYQTAGHDALALAMWQGLAESAQDKATRAIAQENLQRVKDEIAGKRPRSFRKRPLRS